MQKPVAGAADEGVRFDHPSRLGVWVERALMTHALYRPENLLRRAQKSAKPALVGMLVAFLLAEAAGAAPREVGT